MAKKMINEKLIQEHKLSIFRNPSRLNFITVFLVSEINFLAISPNLSFYNSN